MPQSVPKRSVTGTTTSTAELCRPALKPLCGSWLQQLPLCEDFARAASLMGTAGGRASGGPACAPRADGVQREWQVCQRVRRYRGRRCALDPHRCLRNAASDALWRWAMASESVGLSVGGRRGLGRFSSTPPSRCRQIIVRGLTRTSSRRFDTVGLHHGAFQPHCVLA